MHVRERYVSTETLDAATHIRMMYLPTYIPYQKHHHQIDPLQSPCHDVDDVDDDASSSFVVG